MRFSNRTSKKETLPGAMALSTLENAIDAVVVIDTSNRVLFFNSAVVVVILCPRVGPVTHEADELIGARGRSGSAVHSRAASASPRTALVRTECP